MPDPMRRLNATGFTLVEALVTISVLGILALLGLGQGR